MGKYLITGNAGTGKSTIILELQRRGFHAVDGDELAGIHTFMDKKTGALVGSPGPEGFSRYTTVWRPEAFDRLLQENSTIFVGGSVYNQDKFYDSFDKIFCLKAEPEILESRLASRTNNPAGNDKEDRDYLIAINDRGNANLKQSGAIMIDSNQSIEIIADEILTHCNLGNRK